MMAKKIGFIAGTVAGLVLFVTVASAEEKKMQDVRPVSRVEKKEADGRQPASVGSESTESAEYVDDVAQERELERRQMSFSGSSGGPQ